MIVSIRAGQDTFAALEVGERDAPLILCLHGFPDHPPSFEPLASELASRGYRVVVPWMRGYAPSPLTGPFDVDQLVADVRAMLESLGASEAYLLGHDWGAVLTYAALAGRAGITGGCAISVPHPAAFVRNAIRSAAQLRRSSYMLRFQSRDADRWLADDDHAFVRQLWKQWSPGFELSAEQWIALRATLAASHPAPLGYYRALARPLLASLARLRRWSSEPIEVPFLTIFGADDGCIQPDMARGSDRFFSRSHSIRVIENAGHFIHLEQPALLASIVVEHFARGRR